MKLMVAGLCVNRFVEKTSFIGSPSPLAHFLRARCGESEASQGVSTASPYSLCLLAQGKGVEAVLVWSLGSCKRCPSGVSSCLMSNGSVDLTLSAEDYFGLVSGCSSNWKRSIAQARADVWPIFLPESQVPLQYGSNPAVNDDHPVFVFPE